MAKAGRKSAYGDGRLMNALYAYCDERLGKITATDFCRWCNLPETVENHPELIHLKGVEPRHFMREVVGIDPNTGERVKTKTAVRLKIEEINKSREAEARPPDNPILAPDPTEFLSLSRFEQASYMERVRNELRELRRENKILERKRIRAEERIRRFEELESEVDGIRKRLDGELPKLERKLSFVIEKIGDEECRKALERRGISAEETDFGRMLDFLEDYGGKLFSVSETLRDLRREEARRPQVHGMDERERTLAEIEAMLNED